LEATVADYGVKLEEKRTEFARAEQRLLDADLRIKSLEGDYRQQASDQLKVSAAKLAELQQEQRKTVDASTRQVITAPVAGDVINLKFTTPGSVVSPREPIADIVPTNPRLVVEAHIRTEDVSRVQQGSRRTSASLPLSTARRGWCRARCSTWRRTARSIARPTRPTTWHWSRQTPSRSPTPVR
jgi:hypothetical protein